MLDRMTKDIMSALDCFLPDAGFPASTHAQ